MFYMKATVSGRVRQLLTKMLAFCDCGKVDNEFYITYDDEIFWGEGDDHFDGVTKYVNYLTGNKSEHRKLLRLVYDLHNCCGSTCILRINEVDNNCSSILFICDQDSDELYDIAYDIYLQLICCDEVQSIVFKDL